MSSPQPHAEPVLPSGASDEARKREPLHLLYVLGPRSSRGWLQQTLDQTHPAPIQVRETPLLPTALECLRESAFDVLVIDEDATERSPQEMVSALRSGTCDQQAIIVLAGGNDRRRASEFLAAGASAYLSLGSTNARELVWQLYDANERSRVQSELQKLEQWRARHEDRQQAEIMQLLEEQASIFGFADQLRSETAFDQNEAAWQETRRQCAELLQAYVLMGRGQLAAEVQHLAGQLYRDRVTLAGILKCYSAALTELVQDRGVRSSRHIFDRGNLLLLDLLLKWVDHFAGPDAAVKRAAPQEDPWDESVHHRSDLQ